MLIVNAKLYRSAVNEYMSAGFTYIKIKTFLLPEPFSSMTLFVGKYFLGTPALVKRGLDALLEKEMIFYQSAVEKPYYEVYDKFLMRWLQYK